MDNKGTHKPTQFYSYLDSFANILVGFNFARSTFWISKQQLAAHCKICMINSTNLPWPSYSICSPNFQYTTGNANQVIVWPVLTKLNYGIWKPSFWFLCSHWLHCFNLTTVAHSTWEKRWGFSQLNVMWLKGKMQSSQFELAYPVILIEEWLFQSCDNIIVTYLLNSYRITPWFTLNIQCFYKETQRKILVSKISRDM